MQGFSKVLIGIVAVAVMFGISNAFVYMTNRQSFVADNQTNKEVIVRLEVESCVREAKKESNNLYTDAEIQSYCSCAMNDIFSDKSVQEIKKLQSEYNDTLTITPEMEASMSKCAAQL